MKILWLVRQQDDYLTLYKYLHLHIHAQQAIIMAKNNFITKNIYYAPRPHQKIFFNVQSYLGTYAKKGELNYKYLKKDLLSMEKAIQDYQPDILISLGRFSAFIAAQKYHLKHYYLAEKSLQIKSENNLFHAFNKLLKENDCRQIINYNDLQKYATPFSLSSQIKIIDADILTSADTIIVEKGTSFDKLIRNSLTSFKYITKGQLLHQKPELIIHQENIYLYNCCLQAGIPQIILPRYGYCAYQKGIYLNHAECNKKQLYEAIQYALKSSFFKQQAKIITTTYQPLNSLF